MFKIEKKIPIPDGWSRHLKYPWKEMEIGDSFFIEKEMNTKGLYGAAAHQGIKICIRRVDNGLRVWRVK